MVGKQQAGEEQLARFRQGSQARDRFAAGVSDTIEVTRAQESLARASEDYISALYQHNVAKATLARAAGVAEPAIRAFAAGVK